MNITLVIDEKLAEEARRAAQSMGLSLNQAVRAYLERLAGREQIEAEFQAFEQSARRSPGRRGNWKFDRDELHERS
jgi:antitoxin component of RelBE/YafQ-DinJ toxin-antitoxin module